MWVRKDQKVFHRIEKLTLRKILLFICPIGAALIVAMNKKDKRIEKMLGIVAIGLEKYDGDLR